jgi:hypothetical protein
MFVNDLFENKKITEGSAQDRLHRRHQELRKKSGLPDPDYYKELKASYDIEDDTKRIAAQAEIKKKYRVAEGSLNEFAPDGFNGGDDDDEYDLLYKLAKMWWTGNEQQHIKATKTLASMGIEIDEDDPNIILRKGNQFMTFSMDDFEQGVAEAAGLYGPFTLTINTGERPNSRTKTKKFRREDDAILWAEDWFEDFPQYVFATAEITDPEGNVVWYSDETMVSGQGVAEAGPFSYGAKKPRKGSVADLAAKKHKEQEKNKKPIEPKDQMVGVAKVVTNEDIEGYLEEMRRAGYDIVTESATLCPECGGPAYEDKMLAEKQDACYSKVKSRYKVWPSAYASGALVRCRKVGAKNWGNKSKK